jgi:glutaredoxin
MKASRRSLAVLVLLVMGAGAATQWWAGRQEADLGRAMATAAKPGDIRMIASDTCLYCAAARQWFEAYRVPFTECSIERDERCARDYRESMAPGTPVIVVRGRRVVGFDPQQVLKALG